MIRTAFTIVFSSVLGVAPLQAQRARCGTPEPAPPGSGGAPFPPSDCGYFTNTPQPEYEPSIYYDIPVVFHVIQDRSGEGFLDLATLQDQIDVLNEDFQAIAGSPGAPGTNARVRFHLAATDPSGNPTTGVTYSMDDDWFLDNGDYWTPLAWDTNRYMNIYTNAVPCCYGYVSAFPAEGIAGQADDRIVVWWEAVGRDATAGWPLNMGRTSTHEVGHYLGLYHTFCGGCGSATACYSTGDLICDTEREANERFGCPTSASSCGSPDPIHNYMDYTDDPCLWEFTPEQANRIRCTLEHWRPDLDPAQRIGTTYCSPNMPNSTGASGILIVTGSSVDSDDDLTLTATELPPEPNIGYFLMGTGSNAFIPPGAGSFLCVAPGLKRFVPRIDNTNEFPGGFERVVGTQGNGHPVSAAITPGSTWNFQAWHRDAAAGVSHFTDAVSVTFQ